MENGRRFSCGHFELEHADYCENSTIVLKEVGSSLSLISPEEREVVIKDGMSCGLIKRRAIILNFLFHFKVVAILENSFYFYFFILK